MNFSKWTGTLRSRRTGGTASHTTTGMGPPQDNGTFHLRVLVEGQCAVISVLVHSNTEVEVLKQLILSHGLHSLEGVHSDRCSLFMVSASRRRCEVT